MRIFFTLLSRSFILLFSFTLFAQDTIVKQSGEKVEAKITAFTPQIVSYEKAGVKEAIPTAELKWFSIGSKIYAVHPKDASAEDIHLTLSLLKEAIDEKEYSVLLNSKTILEDMVFATGKVELTPASRAKVLPALKYLAQQKDFKYNFSVHTDSSGSPASNLAISQRRATALSNLFKSQGLTNVQIIGRGMEEPAFTKKSEQLKNRRVEFTISSIDNVELIYAEEAPLQEVNVEEKIPEPEVVKNEAKPVTRTTNNNTKVTKAPKVKTSTGKGISFTIAAKASQVIGDNPWTNSDLIGINRMIGGDITLNYRIGKVLGLIFNTGLYQGKIDRQFVSSGVLQYNEQQTLQQIPIQAGFRLYVMKGLYLQATGGGQYLTLSLEDSGYEESESAIKIGYGGAIGYEFKAGQFLFDLSGHYNDILTRDFAFSGQSMPSAGLRLGVGFDFKK